MSGTGWVTVLKIGIIGRLGLGDELELGIPGNNQGFGFIQMVRERVEDIGIIQDS